MSSLTEKVCRLLAAHDKVDPDWLEPGDLYGTQDGVCPNGDVGHFKWRCYTGKAKQIISLVRHQLRK